MDVTISWNLCIVTWTCFFKSIIITFGCKHSFKQNILGLSSVTLGVPCSHFAVYLSYHSLNQKIVNAIYYEVTAYVPNKKRNGRAGLNLNARGPRNFPFSAMFVRPLWHVSPRRRIPPSLTPVLNGAKQPNNYLNVRSTWFILRSNNLRVSSRTQATRYLVSETKEKNNSLLYPGAPARGTWKVCVVNI